MSHVLDLIGQTPLIRLDGPSKATGCEILGKAEFLNPGGSVKDRAALNIVREAEASGTLKPGGTIVEGTAGNTGIGLALVGGALHERRGARERRRAVGAGAHLERGHAEHWRACAAAFRRQSVRSADARVDQV